MTKMKTNDIFNFRRFGKYFVSDMRTCWSNYGLSLITISLIMPVVVYVLTTAFNMLLRSTWDGPDMGLRVFVFALAIICIVVTMPVKCYGRITEKQYGSFWLSLPVSRLEKFISMFLLTCIIVPALGTGLYLGIDAVICSLDHTCGHNLVWGAGELLGKMHEMKDLTMDIADEYITIEDAATIQDIMKQIGNPWIYIDEIFGMTLPFLLGAVFFRNGKTVKTFLSLIAVGTAFSLFLSPVMANLAKDIASQADQSPELVMQFFNKGVFRNLVLIDTLSDTVVNIALMAGIWFRIKTLKH